MLCPATGVGLSCSSTAYQTLTNSDILEDTLNAKP